ncbi:hypothetical protein MYX06_01940 [Patescibacteria group bacterium AH-259-L05]|nr:hypothetical protein [Patescibacteria group bacterium AH-259-L05]
MAINIGSKGGWAANVLSNFAATPFVIDGVECASAEGFIQALKFPNPEMQTHVCSLVGRAAKFKGKKANRRIRHKQKVWWQGQEFGFRSPEHFALIERALRAKFTQSNRARKALVSTRDATLTHNLGHPESPHTSLPARKFIRMLYKIRQELQDD